MDNFFLQDNSHKRKFIDKLISTIDNNHISRLNIYTKLIKERLTLLLNSNNTIWLNKIEQEIASVAVAIVASRIDFLNKLNIILKNTTYYPLSLSFVGEVESLFLQNQKALKVEQDLEKLFFNTRSIDKLYKINSLGAHKSNLNVVLKDNKDIEQNSVGEQKLMLLHIMDAFFKLTLNLKKMAPILLLDEINVHLDSKNIDYVINNMLSYNCQLFITATSSFYYNSFKNKFKIINL